ncbi:MAG TPA: hypothetical protein VNU71_14655 [Burkholderiaceae bacterium]|nr:hypothetical protein [Burkholderiaceae bacterium]
MASDAEAKIWGVMAASGTGKGVWIKGQLRELKPARLVIWDFKDEYGEFAKPAKTLADVLKAMRAAGADGALRLRYRPRSFGDKAMRREFETLCSLVQAWGSCTYLVEELSNVTMPGWAPPAWRMMASGGRHELIHIIGVSQNPASIDKMFLSNCTLIHVGPLHEEAHRDAVERSMDVMRGSLADLVKFQWVEKNRDTGEFTAGVVRIKGVPAPALPVVPQRRRRVLQAVPNAPTGRPASGTATGAPRPGQAGRRAATLQPVPPPTHQRPLGQKVKR